MIKKLNESGGGKFVEAQKDEKTGKLRVPVVIISQGLGNLGDRNYYTAEAIASGVKVYEGKKAYFDHPTATQSQEQPGRSVKETCGHYEECSVAKDESGLSILKAFFVPEKNSPVIDKIEHAIEYKKTYPGNDYIGISINGDGIGVEMEYEEFLEKVKPSPSEMEKIRQIEGQSINVITQLTDAVSADLVTEAGAKGRILLESNKQKRSSIMLTAFRKLFTGLEKKDHALIEGAVKDMLQDEKKEGEKAEEGKEDSKAKAMLQAWKEAKAEMKQEEGESEEAYEARCMQAAFEKCEKKESEKAEKEDESEEKHEAADKKDAAKDDAADDKDHADADQDKALIKKMMKQMDEMKQEIESMKSEKKEMAKESAEVKVKLAATEHAKLVTKVLAETELHPVIANEVKPVLEACKTEAEMKDKAVKMKEAYSKVLHEQFFGVAAQGFAEIVSESEAASTDHLF